jgi:hypothetical protein
MPATRTETLAETLAELARALEPLLGPGRSAAVWSLGDEVRLVYAGGQPAELLSAAARRLREGDASFEVQGGPGAYGSVHVCRLGDQSAACGLFVDEAEQPHLEATIGTLIEQAEAGMRKRVEEMSRTEKQRVVRFLDERGAFLIRRAVADVAARLGVTRFTIYNYLDRDA